MTDNDIDAIRPVTDLLLLLLRLRETVGEIQAHDHPDGGSMPDLYCLNLTGFLGERMGPVLRRLADEQAETRKWQERHTALADEFTAEADRLHAKVDELTAALAQSREQAATYANEIGTLTAENARLRQQRDGLLADLTDAGNDVDLLTAENSRLRPVVEAAKAWRSERVAGPAFREAARLMAAIDALPKAEATR